jgi:hypothetical protein
MDFENNDNAFTFVTFWWEPGSLNTTLQVGHVWTKVDVGLGTSVWCATIVIGIWITFLPFTTAATRRARDAWHNHGWTTATATTTTATMGGATGSWCRTGRRTRTTATIR